MLKPVVTLFFSFVVLGACYLVQTVSAQVDSGSNQTLGLSSDQVNVDLVVTREIPGPVGMKWLGFEPEQIKLSPGTTVIWTNKDSDIHTVTSGVPQLFTEPGNAGDPGVLFDSDYLAQGETFQFTFNDPGKFPYYDKENSNLGGVVFVTNSSQVGN